MGERRATLIKKIRRLIYYHNFAMIAGGVAALPMQGKEGLVLLACCCVIGFFFVCFFRRCIYRCFRCCKTRHTTPPSPSYSSSPLLLPPTLSHHAPHDLGRYKHISHPPYILKTTTTTTTIQPHVPPPGMFQTFAASNTQPTSTVWYDAEASAPIYHDRHENQNAVVIVAEPWEDRQTPKGTNPQYL